MDLFNLKCPICDETSVEPVTAVCLTHTFCRECLASWIRRRQDDQFQACCPVCRRPLTGMDPASESLRVNTDIAQAILLTHTVHIRHVNDMTAGALVRALAAHIWHYVVQGVHAMLNWIVTWVSTRFEMSVTRPLAAACRESARLSRIATHRITCAWRTTMISLHASFQTAVIHPAAFIFHGSATVSARITNAIASGTRIIPASLIGGALSRTSY